MTYESCLRLRSQWLPPSVSFKLRSKWHRALCKVSCVQPADFVHLYLCVPSISLVFYSVYLAASGLSLCTQDPLQRVDSLAVLRGFSVCEHTLAGPQVPRPSGQRGGAPVSCLASVAPWLMGSSPRPLRCLNHQRVLTTGPAGKSGFPQCLAMTSLCC